MTVRADAKKVIKHTAQVICFMTAVTCIATQPANIQRKRNLHNNGVILHFVREDKITKKG